MATIGERAREKYSTVSYEDYQSLTKISVGGLQSIKRECYMKGATEQRKIDIEKACKVYEELMTCSGYYPEAITAELARMRNKLED